MIYRFQGFIDNKWIDLKDTPVRELNNGFPVRQWTRLKDKWGQPIWEGQYVNHNAGIDQLTRVRFEESCAGYYPLMGGIDGFLPDNFEVIQGHEDEPPRTTSI
jgi:hypothetical protein